MTIKTDVAKDAFSYLLEHREEFRGVVVEKRYLRDYPYKELGAQLFGTLREISPERAEGAALPRRRGRHARRQGRHRGDLRQVPARRGRLHARGHQRARQPRRHAPGHRQRPIQGDQLRLTLDLGLQRAANDAMKRAIAAANLHGNGAKAGAYVALDPRNGEVLALGSYPSFDANLFAKPLSQSRFDQLNSQANGAPLFNRAIAATYPTGSTFKPITAHGGAGERDHRHGLDHHGHGQLPARRTCCCRTRAARRYGPLNVTQALKVSSDVFFYTLGERANPLPGEVIQTWARRLGPRPADGHRHPGRAEGPRPGRRVAQHRLRGVPEVREAQPRRGAHERGAVRVRRDRAPVVHGRQRQPRDRPGRPPGDAAADGGRLLDDRQRRPRRARRTSAGRSRTALGRQIEEITKPPRAQGRSSPRATSRRSCEGLRGAAMEDGGTSAAVMKGFPLHRVRQDRHGRAPRPARPVLVRRLRAAQDAARSSSR